MISTQNLHDGCNPTDSERALSLKAAGSDEGKIDEPKREQLPLDLVDEACMESFPCSDPPSYTRCHA